MATTQIRGDVQIKSATVKTAQLNIDADFNIQSHKLTSVTDPSNPQDAATKNYVDTQLASVASSGHVVRAATTANITLSGTQTIDGVSLSVADRVLVKNQSTGANNGLYAVASGAWTRVLDFDAWAEVPGAIVSVEEGTTNADTVWLSTADLDGTLGSTSITFVQLPGPSDILAGSGLTRSGQTINVGANADSSIQVNADDIQVKRDGAGAIGVSASGIAVNVDTTTIEISSNALRVKPSVYQKIADIITRETPSGSINGSNTTFTLANTPVSGSEQVYLNGILQEPGAGNDYTISGGTITYLTAPISGDRLRVSYLR